MTGIAALAAAAAATQKIPGTSGVTTTPVSGIKVVTPTIVTQGVKVTPVQGKIQGQQGGCSVERTVLSGFTHFECSSIYFLLCLDVMLGKPCTLATEQEQPKGCISCRPLSAHYYLV